MDSSNTAAIILCTFNGENFLLDQLKSIENQNYRNFKLFVFDDCSNDSTKEILLNFQSSSDLDIEIRFNEKRKGFSKNFLDGLRNISDNFEYYFFCDQDDIWLENKINRAVEKISSLKPTLPNLYCSRTLLINQNKSYIGESPLFKKEPHFKNALVQSIAGGNTMAFNRILKQKLSLCMKNVPSHDWFAYLVTTSLNGNVVYDKKPSLLYRQHKKNLIGNNMMLAAKLSRFYSFFIKNDFKGWVHLNIESLGYIDKLSGNNYTILQNFKKISSKNLFVRIMSFFQSGIYRQTIFGHIGLFIGAIFKKVY